MVYVKIPHSCKLSVQSTKTMAGSRINFHTSFQSFHTTFWVSDEGNAAISSSLLSSWFDWPFDFRVFYTNFVPAPSLSLSHWKNVPRNICRSKFVLVYINILFSCLDIPCPHKHISFSFLLRLKLWTNKFKSKNLLRVSFNFRILWTNTTTTKNDYLNNKNQFSCAFN